MRGLISSFDIKEQSAKSYFDVKREEEEEKTQRASHKERVGENELVDLVVGREVISHEEKEETTEGARLRLDVVFRESPYASQYPTSRLFFGWRSFLARMSNLTAMPVSVALRCPETCPVRGQQCRPTWKKPENSCMRCS